MEKEKRNIIKIGMQFFAAPANTTKLEDMVDPEVLADMISAKLPKKIRVAPFARIDNTLVGTPGSTITVPSYEYIGDAEDVGEGETIPVSKMETTTTTATIKKAAKSVRITDEAMLSSYGNPVGEAGNQLIMSIAAKVDNDAMAALKTAALSYDASTKPISYLEIVSAIDKFQEEINTEKVMFVSPSQVTQLRQDPDFLSADKYPQNVIMQGEIGKIANTRIVPSKKIELESTYYTNPIIKLEGDAETEDELPALTIYLKKDTALETARDISNDTTLIKADKFYTVALTNQSKVVLAKFKAPDGASLLEAQDRRSRKGKDSEVGV